LNAIQGLFIFISQLLQISDARQIAEFWGFGVLLVRFPLTSSFRNSLALLLG